MTTVSVSPPDSSARAGASPAEPDIQFVVCVVAEERYGMEVGRVHEILRMPAITALPGADRTFSGVINLRGRVIPVMDMRQRFGLPVASPTRLSRIVVADGGSGQVGLVVDAVNEVIRVAPSAIEPTPALATTAATAHLTGIARTTDGLVVLLDMERLLDTGIVAAPDAAAPGATV